MIRTSGSTNYGVSFVATISFFGSIFYAFAIQIMFVYGELLSLMHFAFSFMLLTVTLLYAFKRSIIGPLALFFTIAYLIPFNHLIGYLFYGYDDIKSIWTLNPTIRPFLNDSQLVKFVGSIAASAALGITAAIWSSALWEIREKHHKLALTLSIWRYILLLSISILLAWASMPADSIIETAYTQSQARFAWFNWPSAWLLSYIIIALLYSDCIVDKTEGVKLKWLYLTLALFYLVIINDLGNGKRTSLPLVFGLAMYHITFRLSNKKITAKRGLLLCGAAIIFLYLGNLHGALRSEIHQVSSWEILLEIFMDLRDRGALGINMVTHGTWTDVLMTPFSAAYMYMQNTQLLYGQDYLNMILSLPPAFVADYLGYIRPWNSDQSPAWEMIFGNGGVHATVLPFRNFGLIGVAIVSFFSALIILFIEKLQAIKSSFFQPFLYVSMASLIPHWVWYGEKPLINGLIYIVLMMWLYKKLFTLKV